MGTGDVWAGDGGVIKTRGWVFTNANGHQFAVCWNGLVYPTVSVGVQADWREDARACTQRVGREWRSALPEAHQVSYETCFPLKGCLLLRLGEPKLAEELWLALQIQAQRDSNPMLHRGATNALENPAGELATNDPYLQWAGDWAWNLFERAVCAHMRGDDGLALASARLLSSARPLIESEAERRGFQRLQTYASPWDGKYQDHLNFLDPLPSLLAEQERRAQSVRSSRSSAEIEGLTNQSARIAAWIDALEDVGVRQWGQPGGLAPWETDPVVAGLLKEGESAIEPLLECLEGDRGNRLTRSVSFGRAFHRGRTLHPVSRPVVSILLKLMNASDAGIGFHRSSLSAANFSNAMLAAKFRRYWEEFGQIPLAERWYRKLADDSAGQDAWADALGNIVRAEKVSGDSNEAQVAGESLRPKTSPSVTEILLERSTAIAESAPSYNTFAIHNAVGFLLNTEKWEASPHLLRPATQLQVRVMAHYRGTDNVGSTDPQNAVAIASLAMLRARHGDTRGLEEYAAWIDAADPNILRDVALDALEPFWRFPENPRLRAAATAMFANTNSSWGTLDWCLSGGRKRLASPALVIPEFRALVVRELTNREVAGEAINHGGGTLQIKYANGGGSTHGGRKDTEGLEVGARVAFRRCDLVVEQLSAIPGFPVISFLWPEDRRDQSVSAAIQLLTESGHRLKVRDQPERWLSVFDPPLVELTN